MRMWMIDPSLLCRKHLLGEHSEIHKHWHSFNKHHSIDGRFVGNPQIEPASMESRHNQLAQEMLKRGYNHKSPYTQPDISYLPEWQQTAQVNLDYNIQDLSNRCDDCRERIESK